MDRYAVFVDAGYLLAGAGHLLHQLPRGLITCNYPATVSALTDWCGQHTPHESLLRLYWYDGAPNLQPTEEHHRIAALPDVKLRLGRVTSKGQKGVDSRIVRDLIVLAHQRAITTAYLLSGDEDLREGVAEAQEAGVRLVLLGMPDTDKSRQSFSLVCEADEHVLLDAEFWTPLLTPVDETSGSGQAVASDVDDDEIRSAARDFTLMHLSVATAEDRAALSQGAPRIPQDLDRALLQAVENHLEQSIRELDLARRIARAEFWTTVTEAPDE